MNRHKTFLFALMIAVSLLTVSCAKSTGQSNMKPDEDKKTIEQLKNEKSALIEENKKLKNEVENYKKLLELRNFLDSQFSTLLYDMRSGNIEEIEYFVDSNIYIEKDKLSYTYNSRQYEFRYPKETTHFRERWFELKDDTFEAVYEVHVPGLEMIPECYITYMLKDDEWKITGIFVDPMDIAY